MKAINSQSTSNTRYNVSDYIETERLKLKSVTDLVKAIPSKSVANDTKLDNLCKLYHTRICTDLRAEIECNKELSFHMAYPDVKTKNDVISLCNDLISLGQSISEIQPAKWDFENLGPLGDVITEITLTICNYLDTSPGTDDQAKVLNV